MKIKLTTVHVDDQDRALRFYTEVLGLAKKADFSQGTFRWLTVSSPEEPEGAELQLARADDPAARAYQEARFQQGQPAILLYTEDVRADCQRITERGVALAMPPTEVPGSVIAKVHDGCGNVVQLVQLARWK